jgi:hypothetical protein
MLNILFQRYLIRILAVALANNTDLIYLGFAHSL